MTLPQLTAQRERILDFARRHGATQVRVFGSTVRGEATPTSDVDLLVDLEPDRSLIDLGAFLMDVQDLLGCRVDMMAEEGLHAHVRDRILGEAVPL
jgi:predicted nucleotidyltransferase